MIQKIYGVFGLMEYTINVTLGARVLKIPFTGGMASKDGIRPATYATGNPVIQFAIENSKQYKGGHVKLLKIIGTGTPVSPERHGEANEPASTDSNHDTEDKNETPTSIKVACIEDAREYLISNCDGKASNLRSKKAILDYATTRGIVFECIEE